MNKILVLAVAELYWLEYEDAAQDARDALASGDKLRALALAIQAHKMRNEAEYHANKLILG